MTTMNISLPDEMKAWIENTARGDSYSNTSDFMRDIVRREQERRATIAELQRLVDDGIASGVSTRTMDEIFEEAMRKAESLGRVDA